MSITGQVLIVEDEVNIRVGLRDILVKDGHQVTDVGIAGCTWSIDHLLGLYCGV